MRVKQVTHGLATVELTTVDCALLARMCEAGLDELVEKGFDHGSAMESAFGALALICCAEMHLNAPTLEAIKGELCDLAIGDLIGKPTPDAA